MSVVLLDNVLLLPAAPIEPTGVAGDLIASFEPWMTDDLYDYLNAVGSMFAAVEALSADAENGEGWSLALDPDLCPPEALPYLAQFVGERLPVGLAEPFQREWIKDEPNSVRGTVPSILRAAQRSLTGNRKVALLERGGVNDPDLVVVRTYASETPFPARVLHDLQDVMPADMTLDYRAIAGSTWGLVNANYASWGAVKADNATWADVARNERIAGVFRTFARPVPQ